MTRQPMLRLHYNNDHHHHHHNNNNSRHHRRQSPRTMTMGLPSSFCCCSFSMLFPATASSTVFRRAMYICTCIIGVAVFLGCLSLLYFSAVDSFSFRFSSAALPHIFPPSIGSDNGSLLVSDEDRLKKVLKEAAMEDATVILTTLNEAWAVPNSILDLFLESFSIGEHTDKLLKHLVIVALDQKAYLRCMAVHHHCFALVTEGVDFHGEAYFMTTSYLKMMWRRIDFLRSVLEFGYNFIFTDADIMWLRDPFPRFYLDADFQIACDIFLNSSVDLDNTPNGGFNYVKSNNRSIEFYKYWYSSRYTYPGQHDQDVLNIIKHSTFVKDLGLQMRFLNTSYFGGFCEHGKDFNVVCTMHANCCFGLDSKLHDLKIVLQDWRKFLSLPPNLRRSSLVSWSVPQNCSLDSRIYYNNTEEIAQHDLLESIE